MEVVIAIGLAAFCLVALIGLVGAGLRSQRESLEETMAASLATDILEDIRNTPAGEESPRFDIGPLPAAGAEEYRDSENIYFSREGESVSATDAYFVLRVLVIPPPRKHGPYFAHVLLEWPAQAPFGKRSGRFEATDAFRLDSSS